MNPNIQVLNDDELVFEGKLKEFLAVNNEDTDFIMENIDFSKKINEFHEVSGHWKIIFV